MHRPFLEGRWADEDGQEPLTMSGGEKQSVFIVVSPQPAKNGTSDDDVIIDDPVVSEE